MRGLGGRGWGVAERAVLVVLAFIVYFIAYRVVGLSFLEAVLLGAAASAAAAVSSRVSIPPRSIRGFSVNLGGFCVPLIVSLDLYARLVYCCWGLALPVVVSSLVVAVLVFLSSRDYVGRGIGVPVSLPVFLAAGFSAMIAYYYGLPWLYAAPIAIVIGVWGVVLGADVLKVLYIRRRRGSSSRYDLGGAGLMDIVFVSSALSPSIGLAVAVIAYYTPSP